jgi:RNA-directed DNA polymerase
LCSAQGSPKPDGRKRPLGITSIEDKIIQRTLCEILQNIYEVDFLGFSYGFRPGKSQHDALDALSVAISGKRVNWVLDADIEGFFDTIDHEWLMKFLEHRIGDRRERVSRERVSPRMVTFSSALSIISSLPDSHFLA